MSAQAKNLERHSRWTTRIATFVGFLLILPFVLVLGLGVTLSIGVTTPDWVRAQVENSLNDAMPDGGVTLGSVEVSMFGAGLSPTVLLSDVAFIGEDGIQRATLPKVEAELDRSELFKGQLRPAALLVDGAEMSLTRDLDGQLDISFGDENADTVLANRAVRDLLATVEQGFETPFLAQLKKIEAKNTVILLDDQLSERIWLLQNGTLQLLNTDNGIESSVHFTLEDDGGKTAEASFSLSNARSSEVADFSAQFAGVSSLDLADEIPALDWLRVLDAPIAGAVTMKLGLDGKFGALDGVLVVGAGQIRQSADTEPFTFRSAKMYLSYDDALEKMTFAEISVDTEAASLRVEGHAYLSERIDRTVGALIGQFQFSTLSLDPAGFFEEPLEFNGGALDVRVQLDPLKLDIGQIELSDETTKYQLRGEIGLSEQGWETALDLNVDSISRDRVQQLWPLFFKPNSRKWLAENVMKGQISNVVGAFRRNGAERPRFSIGFDLDEVTARYMKTMPVLEQARGYGVLTHQTLHVVAQAGQVQSPDAGMVDVAGTVFHVPDITIPKAAPSEILVKAGGDITSILSVMNQEPFSFMTKAERPVDLAEGTMDVVANINLNLAEKIAFEDVGYSVVGRLHDVVSDKLVPEKTLRSKVMSLRADPSQIEIAGDAVLGELPVSGGWIQKSGDENAGRSKVEGTVEFSQRFLDEFNIALPKGSLTGVGVANIDIELVKNEPPVFRLVSDLNRVRLAVPAINWAKSKNTTGTLEVSGALADPVRIDSFALNAAGMTAEGQIELGEGNAFKVARFANLRIGGWLNAPLEIRPGSGGELAFSVQGGQADFRKSNFGGSVTGAGSQGNKVSVTLDRLTISSGIVLTGFDGSFDTSGGVSGEFVGSVNGGARIIGSLAPLRNGVGVKFTSADAGAVMRSAGLFDSARGGRMTVVMAPTTVDGQYNGTLAITETRVRNAPALAELLSAISVIGLLQQLDGEGLAFQTVDADFVLTPQNIQLNSASAVGASMGITMAGVYNQVDERLNMQGVITPIYAVNGLLEQTKIFGGLFGKQKGEGLFGFNYRMSGTVDDPKISVNPLSILTPGIFREIFRRPVPKVPQ